VPVFDLLHSRRRPGREKGEHCLPVIRRAI
jgi:hypothetical protein